MKSRAKVAAAFASIVLLLLTVTIASRVSCGGVARAREGGAGTEVPSGTQSVVRGTDAGVISDPSGEGGDSLDAVRPTTAASFTSGAAPADERRAPAPLDQLELHSLTAWDASQSDPCVYLSFTPISLDDLFGGAPVKRTVFAGEEIEVADVAPELDPSHVTVSLDGDPAPVLSLEWYYAGYGDLSGSDTKYMPVCVMRVERPQLAEGEHRVNVEIEDVTTGAVGRSAAVFTSGAA
ncbi:MAG: hypothetical protein JXB46_04070, partial [Candidatus Eisenbacteria bacterium]|nr:hypothetical protein [Candidatus Eisenbacteria bacterium]